MLYNMRDVLVAAKACGIVHEDETTFAVKLAMFLTAIKPAIRIPSLEIGIRARVVKRAVSVVNAEADNQHCTYWKMRDALEPGKALQAQDKRDLCYSLRNQLRDIAAEPLESLYRDEEYKEAKGSEAQPAQAQPGSQAA